MKKYILDNGWEVTKSDGESAVLHVFPISNSLFRKEQFIDIPNSVFEDIASGESRVKELFRKHKLHNIIFQAGGRKPAVSSGYRSTKDKYFGKDFMLSEEGGAYYLTYELSRHGGGHRKIPITKEIYEDAKSGVHSSADLFKKYNLYRFDVPDNDVK